MRRLFMGLLLGGVLASRAWAAESFVVEDIRVEGLQRISAGTVFNYLPIKVGETMDEARSAEAIRALFKTGFFQDVRLEREGNVLVLSVHERPAISAIDISGNKDIGAEELKEALKNIGLAEGRVFDRSILDRVEQELQRQYFSRGKYGVKITSTVTPLERNRVGISIDISEGRVARIHQINIVGNSAFSDKKLLGELKLTIPTMFSFFTKSDQYSKQQLAADLEALRSYYLDRGYINFNIDSTQVAITPDKKDIYITVNITEGEQFSVKDVKLAGDLVVPEEELRALISVQSGDTFSRKAITETNSKVIDRLGRAGYAFANVNAVPDIDSENKQVSLTFFVDPGKRVYVRRINMVGNTKTSDEVLRREVRQMEGGWISTDKVQRSRERLERTGYFKEVNVETPAVPGTTDQVDVNFSVVEEPSGSLAAGVGYSQSQGLLFNTSVTQDNFLGTGRRLSFAFNNSDVNKIYSFGYNNPYYTIDGVSRGFNFFYRETDAGEANVGNFTTDVAGGGMSFGVPVNEFDTVRLGIDLQNTKLKSTDTTPQEYLDFITANGSDFATLKLSGSWAHDERNRAVFADRGALQRFSVQFAGGDLRYYKVDYRHLKYLPLTKSLTLSLNGEVGYGDSMGSTTDLPFFENYYAGGPGTVRGFKSNTLGPRAANGDPLGGNIKLVGNIELVFPPPFVAKDSRSVRMSGFVDVGNVYGFGQDFDAGDLRYSAGVSATWLSPFGPLTFSLAQPFNDKGTDETEVFQFQLGTTF